MELTKSFTQYYPLSDRPESYLNVVVDFDPKERVVTQIIKVFSYNYRYQKETDLTAIFAEQLSTQLEEIIDSIDWFEVYMERKGVAA